jgi:hypothetical protein
VGVPLLVTVVLPGGLRADLAVPGDLPVADLLDLLRAALPGSPPAPAALAPLGGEPLPPAGSLTACGIGDGAVLTLAAGCATGQAPAPLPGRRGHLPAAPGPSGRHGAQTPAAVPPLPAWEDRPPTTASSAAGWPRRPPAAVPGPWPLRARLSLALRTLLDGTGQGTAEPGGATGPRRSLARARHAWRGSSYEGRLRAAVAAAPSARCALVAVAGAAPRAGATTVAALLAAVLAAERPGRTVAVDASPGPGCLTELLAPCHDLFTDELVGLLDHPMLARRELAAVLARRGRLGVLAARPPAGSPDQRGWARALQALGRHATTVVVDCGPGAATPGARAALAAADQVVLVDRAAGDLPAGAVARVPGAGGAVLLPADPVAAATLAAPAPPGAPLDLARLPPLWRRRADELAMLLAVEWPSLAPGVAERPSAAGGHPEVALRATRDLGHHR